MKKYLQHKQCFSPLLTSILLTSLLGLFSCEEILPDPTPDKEEILADEGTFFPMEVAQLSLKGEKVGTGKVQGMLNGQSVEIQLYDTVMVFEVPDIAPGVHGLEAPHGDRVLTSSVTVKELVLSSTPDQIFQRAVGRNTESVQRLTALAESLTEPDKAAFKKDVQAISGWLANARKHYADLSPDEKLKFAKTMAANQWWLDEVHAAVVELSADVNSLRANSAVEDWESRLMNVSRKYVNATIALVKHVPKIAKMAAGGAAVGTVVPVIGTSVGAAVGAGIEIGSFLYDYMQHTEAMHDVLDTAFQPFNEGFESFRLAAEKVEFISKEAKVMETFTSYRSLYSPDQNSSIPVVKTFAGAFSQTESVWETISPKLPEPLSPPKMIEDVASYSKTKREIHGKYLEVSDISNDDVVLLKEEEKDGRLVLTFENKAATVQQFTYKLTYKNSNFSPDFSVTINAEVLPSIIIGKWQIVYEQTSFTLYEEEGEATTTVLEDDQDMHWLQFTADNKLHLFLDYSGEIEDGSADTEVYDYSFDPVNNIITIPDLGPKVDDEGNEYIEYGISGTYRISLVTPDRMIMISDKQTNDGLTYTWKFTLQK